jgi:hypothetical protein
MISDEPDEDADNLDDEILLGTVIGHEAPKPGPGAENATPIADWPPPAIKDAGLNLDHETLAWFKANHADWRAQIGDILQAWVTLKTQANSDARPQG